jgi:predicted branched-subunit amino acid permease
VFAGAAQHDASQLVQELFSVIAARHSLINARHIM